MTFSQVSDAPDFLCSHYDWFAPVDTSRDWGSPSKCQFIPIWCFSNTTNHEPWILGLATDELSINSSVCWAPSLSPARTPLVPTPSSLPLLLQAAADSVSTTKSLMGLHRHHHHHRPCWVPQQLALLGSAIATAAANNGMKLQQVHALPTAETYV